MHEQAIGQYEAAAAVARRRYAETEAAGLLRRALELCRGFPETARRDGRELDLLVALGPSLIIVQGYATPEVGATYARAMELLQRIGEERQALPVLSGAWLFHTVRGEIEKSRDVAQQCLLGAAGERAMAGHFLLGSSLFHLGRFGESREHLEGALAADTGPSHATVALFAGPDVRVFCRSYLSHVLWRLGCAAEARARSDEAITLAREVSHPFSLAIALDYAAMLHVFQADSTATMARAQEAADLCRKHGFVYYLAWAEILIGWGIALEGDPAAGLARLRKGLDALRATGAELRLPFYYGLLAQVSGLAGQQGEALANIAAGFAFQSKNGEVWSSPGLQRIEADLLQRSARLDTAAEHPFPSI